MGSGCGSVGWAVASDTRDPQFESRHRQNFIYQLYDRKGEKEKEAGNDPILIKKTLNKLVSKQQNSGHLEVDFGNLEEVIY